MEIGKRIALLRKENNITQVQLAEFLSVLPQTISRWEVDNGTPDIYLLPKIAEFFNITLEELFGITNDEKLDNLVYKYSVLRDENSYKEVMSRIALELEVARQDKNRQRENELLAKRIHIYIQQGRECVVQAKKECELLLENNTDVNEELYLRLELQRTQLRIENGEGRVVFEETKDAFKETPNIKSLMMYLVALHDLYKDEEILNLKDNEFLKSALAKKDIWSEEIYGFLLYAAKCLNDIDTFQMLYKELISYAGKDATLEAKLSLAKLYAQNGMNYEMNIVVEELLEDVKKVKNEYMRNHITDVIMNIK